MKRKEPPKINKYLYVKVISIIPFLLKKKKEMAWWQLGQKN